MNPVIERLISQDGNSAYRNLPEVIQGIVTEREWQFLTDRQRADLIRSETEPEE
jgi:hypothetical protein